MDVLDVEDRLIGRRRRGSARVVHLDFAQVVPAILRHVEVD